MRAIFLAVLALVSVAQAQQSPPEPFAAERKLVREQKDEQAIAALEALVAKGECQGAVCEANLALALAHAHQTDRAVAMAQKATEKLSEEPPLTVREANNLGVLLFKAPNRQKSHLLAAVKAFRFARAHYDGRASNLTVNLVEALCAAGETADLAALKKELEEHTLIDPSMAILGDFQGVQVQR